MEAPETGSRTRPWAEKAHDQLSLEDAALAGLGGGSQLGLGSQTS